MNHQDVFIRAGKTFVQAAVPIWGGVELAGLDVSILQQGLVAGGSAVLALIWNYALQWSNT